MDNIHYNFNYLQKKVSIHDEENLSSQSNIVRVDGRHCEAG